MPLFTNSKDSLDHLTEGFQLIDFNWRYLFVNEAVIKQSGYSSKQDLLGFTMMEKYPGIENTEMFQKLKTCMVERIPQQLENEFTFPDGSMGWFELQVHPVPEGIFVLSKDINAHKEVEHETLTISEHLERIRQELSGTSGAL